MSLLHFVTGKGGTGKSTLAASLAHSLSQKKEGPVLLLEVQGSGRSLEMLGLKNHRYENTAILGHSELWGARILPRETFHQYFELLLSMGKERSALMMATAAIRERLVDLVIENKVVSAFIDTCPGLEPAVLLGKLHWEATKGRAPEINRPWAHVVVDAPATGHGVMLFKSAFALTEVFSAGVISKQAHEIRSFVQDPHQCRIYLCTTSEELPLAETLELAKSFQEMEMQIYSIFFNRVKKVLPDTASSLVNLPEAWQREVELEIESRKEEKSHREDFNQKLPKNTLRISIPELFVVNPQEMVPEISSHLEEIL